MNKVSDIDRMIMESRYLDSLDREDRSVGLPKQERSQYLDTIKSLNDTNKSLSDTNKSLNDTNKSLTTEIQELKGIIKVEQVRNAKLDEQLKALLKEIKKLQRELKKYKDRNDRSNRNQFGRSSQKRRPEQETQPSRQEEADNFDGTSESIESETVQQPQKTNEEAAGQASTQQPHVRGPRGPYNTMHADMVEIIKCRTDVVPEGMRFICVKTVSEYEKISAIKETRYEVMVVEDEEGNRHDIFVPENPSEKRRPNTETMPGTHDKPSFFSFLATARHQMNIPVYREMIQMANEKMHLCAQTIGNWLHIGAEYLRLLIPSLKEHLLRNLDVLHIDETWTNIRIKTKEYVNGHYVKKYIWVIVNKLTKVVYFMYDNDEQDSRGQRPIRTFLEGFTGGIQTDAYAAYRFFSELDEKNSRAVCWAHARAKLWDSATIAKDEDAQELINEIGYLYGVEVENRVENRTAAEIKARRNQRDVTDTMKRIRTKIRWL